MLSASLLIMVMAAPAGPDPVNAARDGYARCLSAYEQDALGRKIPVADFKTALQTACPDEQSAFRNAVKASERTLGISAKNAEQDAADQVRDYQDDAAKDYASALGAG